MKDKATNWIGDGHQHPSEEELLCLPDGELEPRQAEQVRLHLEACWSCRARAEKFQAAISSFVEYRQLVLKPSIRMPQNRSSFQTRFRQAIAQEKAKMNIWERWRGGVTNRLKLLRRGDGSLLRRLSTAQKSAAIRFNNLREKLSPRIVANAVTTGIVLTSVLTVYFLWFVNAPVVSAEELLNRAESAYENELQVNYQPVIYRQIQVSKYNRVEESSNGESTNIQPVKLELWQDASSSRMKHSIAIQANSTASQADSKLLTATAAIELLDILRANGFNPPAPLSVQGFRVWRNSLKEKHDSVEELKGNNGASLLRLSTIAVATPESTNSTESNGISGGQLIAASLTVRGNDFHPLQQSFRVKNANGSVEEYKVRETSFAVLNLASLKPGFFNDGETTAITNTLAKQMPVASPSVSSNEPPALDANVAVKTIEQPAITANTNTNTAIAGTELEIEIINLLHSAGADTGEQVEVTRQTNGPVVVNGIVETEKRKNEILAALRSVQNNPAVKINVKTVEEAVAEQNRANSKSKQNKINSSDAPVVQMEMREVEGKSFPAESDVRTYFAKQGAGDEAVRLYAVGMVSRSNQAMRYAYALKRLKAQFKLEQLKDLKPEARAKWLGLIKGYARSYQSEINALRRELQPVFGGVGESGGANVIDGDAEIFAAISRLFSAGEASDRALKAAFTTSDAKGASGNLRSAQFWNNLAKAETLAKTLQAAK